MKQSPSYYRARIDVINELINDYAYRLKQAVTEDEKENTEKSIRLLRNGVLPEDENETELVNEKLKSKKYADTDLLFEELTKFNTWFCMYPDKVAGRQYVTTSREFPLMIEGSKQDIIDTIKKGLNQSKDFAFELKLKQKTAKAKLKLLKI